MRRCAAMGLILSLLIGGMGMAIRAEATTQAMRFSAAFSDHMVLQQGKPVHLFGTAAAGKTVEITLAGEAGTVNGAATADSDGRWAVTLPAQAASFSAYTITARQDVQTCVLTDVLFGEVWVCGGQSNMQYRVYESYEAAEWKTKERHPAVRVFRQEGSCDPHNAWAEPQGRWETAADWATVEQCSAVGYYFAEKLYAERQVPVGIIVAAIGGTSITTWLSREIVEANPAYQTLTEQSGLQWDPSVWATAYAYYHTFIEPFRGYQAAGILWYQGEADAERPAVLEQGIPLLVKCWSEVFDNSGAQLPFLAVQIAPYDYPNNGCALTNEAIAKGVATVARTGKALTYPIYDVGLEAHEQPPIHPMRKQPVGERGALAALGLVYEQPGLYSGPVPVSAVARDGKIRLTFSNTGDGLRLLNGSKLKGCVVSYRENSYVPVSAVLTDENTVVLEGRGGQLSLEVGYAFTNLPENANLVNSAGFLPAAFRMRVTQESAPPTEFTGEPQTISGEPTQKETANDRLWAVLLTVLGITGCAAIGWGWHKQRKRAKPNNKKEKRPVSYPFLGTKQKRRERHEFLFRCPRSARRKRSVAGNGMEANTAGERPHLSAG